MERVVVHYLWTEKSSYLLLFRFIFWIFKKWDLFREKSLMNRDILCVRVSYMYEKFTLIHIHDDI